jgi:hypothetical protein
VTLRNSYIILIFKKENIMRISRMSEKNSVPEWAIEGSELASIEQNEKLLHTAGVRINATASNQVNEIDIVTECEYIEKCASDNKTYYYNTTWSDNHIAHLKEYATVCGIGKNVVGVDPTTLVQERQASSEQIVKTASVEETTLSDGLRDALGDPFHIDEHSDMSHMEKANWEQVARQAELPEFSTTAAMKGAILPLRGGEDYTLSNQEGLARNQNSIVDPNALDNLYASDEEDTGQRLRREREEREAATAEKHKAWEQEYMSQMNYDKKIEFDITASAGVVFPTEVLNAQPGLTGDRGVYGKFDPDSIPEKTAGESLSDQNQSRKASIQREETEDRSWDKIKSAPSRMISDNFTDELKKFMK